jgi:hypothetical protein
MDRGFRSRGKVTLNGCLRWNLKYLQVSRRAISLTEGKEEIAKKRA